MPTTVGIGVIGTGFGSRVVAPVFAGTDGCEVVDVVSARDPDAVSALCRNPRVDLVSVHSPPFLHVEHVSRALDARRAVLCDKPFGRNPAEAEAMFGAAEAAAVVHLVNFEFRCDPMRSFVRGLVADDALGPVAHVSWSHRSAGSRVPLRPHGWLFERATGGGWIGAWGSHAVDTLRWMLGELTVRASSPRIDVTERLDRDGRLRRCDVEDGFSALLESDSGAGIALDSSFAAPAPLAPRTVITTEDAVIENVADARVVVHHVDGEREEHRRPDAASGRDHHLEPMRRWAVIVRDAVRAGVAPPGAPTFVDGLACARVLDRLRDPTPH